jgi:hypothetical protein
MRAATVSLVALLLASASVRADVADDTLAAAGACNLALDATFADPPRATQHDSALRRTAAIKPELACGANDALEAFLGLPAARGERAGAVAGIKWIPLRREGASFAWFAGLKAEAALTRADDGLARRELQLIVGARRGPWLLVTTPVLEWTAPPIPERGPDLSVRLRLAREVANQVTVGLEYHSVLGAIGRRPEWNEQANTVTGSVAMVLRGVDITLELGRGLTPHSNRNSGRLSVGRPM